MKKIERKKINDEIRKILVKEKKNNLCIKTKNKR